MTKRSTRTANGQKQTESTQENDGRPTKAQKTSKDEDAGSQSHKKDPISILLSDEIFDLAYPLIDSGYGEKDWSEKERRKPLPKEKSGQLQQQSSTTKSTQESDKSTGKERGYFTSNLSPFECLLCAVLMSKPLSHRLGLRTIATLFSPPFGLTTPKALEDAGFEGRREAMYEARTQHKDKTASQLADLVKGLRALNNNSINEGGGESGKRGEEDLISLKVVYESCEREISNAAKGEDKREQAIKIIKEILTKNIKGLGPTGVDIFLRKIQSYPHWEKLIFPFMDERATEIANELGLISFGKDDCLSAAKELFENFQKNNKNQSKQEFVRLIDILIGIGLEKKVDDVKKRLG